MVYNGTNISLRIPRIQGLNDIDVIESIDNFENLEIGAPPSLEEYISYFRSNISTVPVNVEEGDELVQLDHLVPPRHGGP